MSVKLLPTPQHLSQPTHNGIIMIDRESNGFKLMRTTAVSHATVCKRLQNVWTYSFTTIYNSDTVGRIFPQVKVLTAVLPTSKQAPTLAIV